MIYTPKTFKFLRELARHNDRAWFEANRSRYEAEVRTPSLTLIEAMVDPIRRVHPAFVARARKVGGSLFRIQRDTRFSANKQPYKTHIGITFFHSATLPTARTADTGTAARGRLDAPVFYLHIEPGASFMGGGIWHPQPPALRQIRDYLVDNPASWTAATGFPVVGQHYTLGGDRLQRPPRGYDSNHPLIDDLKRKDFIASRSLSDEEVLRADLPEWLAAAYLPIAPMVDWLCDALALETEADCD